MNKVYCTILSIACFWIYSAGLRAQDKTVMLQFKHRVGNAPLQLFEETYTNAFGEPFVVSKFKYYISHIVVTDINSRETVLANSYYLVNEEDSLSKIIRLAVAGPLKLISFTVGVDSARNVSGVQSGSLDPVNAMFWTWNSGYVFAKLEGQSDASTAPAHSFSWHAGGFRQKENALRKIVLPVNNTGTSSVVVINVNVLKWFDAVHPLKIAASPVCHQPGALAMLLADNYSKMFSVSP